MRIIIRYAGVIVLNYFVTRVILSDGLNEMFYHSFKTCYLLERTMKTIQVLPSCKTLMMKNVNCVPMFYPKNNYLIDFKQALNG